MFGKVVALRWLQEADDKLVEFAVIGEDRARDMEAVRWLALRPQLRIGPARTWLTN